MSATILSASSACDILKQPKQNLASPVTRIGGIDTATQAEGVEGSWRKSSIYFCL